MWVLSSIGQCDRSACGRPRTSKEVPCRLWIWSTSSWNRSVSSMATIVYYVDNTTRMERGLGSGGWLEGLMPDPSGTRPSNKGSLRTNTEYNRTKNKSK